MHKSMRNITPIFLMLWDPQTLLFSCLNFISCSDWNALYKVSGLQCGYLGEDMTRYIKFPSELGPSEIQATPYKSVRLYKVLSSHPPLSNLLPNCDSVFTQVTVCTYNLRPRKITWGGITAASKSVTATNCLEEWSYLGMQPVYQHLLWMHLTRMF